VEVSDAELLQACRAGDARAWEQLVERYGRLVAVIPRRMGMSSVDADDVFQDVFTLLWRHLDSLRDEQRLAAWLITTTRRECWRRLRRAQEHAELPAETPATDPGLLEEIARGEREQAVRQAMLRLDTRCRDLLTALFLDASQPDYGAVARRLGMAVGSIGPTRARCFRKLDGFLRELGIDSSL
jgi:RNA polymerase sigma factor (sigma-70 family)